MGSRAGAGYHVVPRAAVDYRTVTVRAGALAELFAGLLFVLYTVPELLVLGSVARPGVSTLGGIFLIPPFACLAGSAVARARAGGVWSPLGACATVTFLGAAIAITSIYQLSVETLAPTSPEVAVVAFLVGSLLVATGTVATGVVEVFVAADPTWSGIVYLQWPLLSMACLGLFVLLDVGTVVLAVTLPFGLALVTVGLARALDARRHSAAGPLGDYSRQLR